MEKIHGSSAHIKVDDDGLTLFPGGIKPGLFEAVLTSDDRFEDLASLELSIRSAMDAYPMVLREAVIHGEVYGGKCQKMSHVYGQLNFVTFEVHLSPVGGEAFWLNVPDAERFALSCGQDFVHWQRGPATKEWLNEQRDKPSVQAKRNGAIEPQYGEGIVIRAVSEKVRDKWGERILAKHKNDRMREVKTPREIDPEKQRVWAEAREIADEFVVEMRLTHVVDKLRIGGKEMSKADTGTVVKAMIADIEIEEGHTIKFSPEARKCIGAKTAKMFHKWLGE